MTFPRRHLPPIGALLALEALDRLGTASAAAAELSLTQGAVSRQLQTLETQLGAVLIQRERQRLKLTQAGRDYAREARRALGILGQAAVTLRANPGGGSLNLAILPAFGVHWLAPRLARFARAHPGVTVNLSTRLRPFDFASGGFDAAVHYGRRDWPGAVEYLPLLEERILAVAAPALFARPPAGPAAVLSHPLLQVEGRTGDWPRWLAHHGVTARRPGGMMFDQFATALQAAVHGLGIALLPMFMADGELAAGRLVAAWGGPVRGSGDYYLVWPRDADQRGPLSSFRSFLAAPSEPT